MTTTSLTFDELLSLTETTHQFLRDKYSKDLDPYTWALANTVKITEEVGELSEQILANGAMQRSNKNVSTTALASEVADVLITTLILGHIMDVDVKAALSAKISKIKQRQLDK